MSSMRLAWFFGTLLALVALAVPAASAADITYTGEVTYRERIALPPGAQLRVTLVSLPHAGPIAGATAALAGRSSPPLQFTLAVRSSVVRPDRDYGLLAEISSQGRVLFRNTQPVPVDSVSPDHTMILVNVAPAIPQDRPEQILPPPNTPRPLLDIVWIVTSIGGDPVLPGSKLTFSIAADQRAGGNGGCNNYFAEADFDAAPLSLGPIAGTRMACNADIMAQEARFFAALGATFGYEFGGDTLKLMDASGVPLIGLVSRQ